MGLKYTPDNLYESYNKDFKSVMGLKSKVTTVKSKVGHWWDIFIIGLGLYELI